MELQKSGI